MSVFTPGHFSDLEGGERKGRRDGRIKGGKEREEGGKGGGR